VKMGERRRRYATCGEVEVCYGERQTPKRGSIGDKDFEYSS